MNEQLEFVAEGAVVLVGCVLAGLGWGKLSEWLRDQDEKKAARGR